MSSRIRQLNYITPINHSETLLGSDGSSLTLPTLGCVAGDWAWMQDVTTPRFKERQARGDIIVSPATSWKYNVSSTTTGYCHQAVTVPPASPKQWYSDRFTSLLHWKKGPPAYGALSLDKETFTVADRNSARARAATAALADWKGSSVQSLVFIAELRKTLQTLRNPISALTSELARGRRKGWIVKGSKGTAFARGVSGQYLTWKYGIKSLMYDVEGTLEAVKRMSKCGRTASRAKDVLEIVDTPVTAALHQGSMLTYCSYTTYRKHKLTVRAGLLGDVEMGIGFDQGFGLRLRDIAGSAWELVPWSFVLDWVVNVGDYVESLAADISTGVKGQWITEVDEVEWKREVNPSSFTLANSSWYISTPCSDSDTVRLIRTSRYPANLADFRSLRFRANLTRVPELAALSLLIQSIVKRR